MGQEKGGEHGLARGLQVGIDTLSHSAGKHLHVFGSRKIAGAVMMTAPVSFGPTQDFEASYGERSRIQPYE